MIDSKALDLSDHLVTFSVPLDGGYAKANPANPVADDVDGGCTGDPTVLKYGFDGIQKCVIIISWRYMLCHTTDHYLASMSYATLYKVPWVLLPSYGLAPLWCVLFK